MVNSTDYEVPHYTIVILLLLPLTNSSFPNNLRPLQRQTRKPNLSLRITLLDTTAIISSERHFPIQSSRSPQLLISYFLCAVIRYVSAT